MRRLALLLAMFAAASANGAADAREIAADLSSHAIEITAGFDGAELLLFGHDSSKGDVIVIVRGPEAPIAVRRKERTAGIWVNQAEVSFPSAPGFYYVAVTDGLRSDGKLSTILAETGLGARYLGLPAEGDADSALVDDFRNALIELRGREQLYATEPGAITMRDDGLFRTSVPFPAAVPVGKYVVTVYHVVDDWPVAGATTPLTVRKAGFGAFVYNSAQEYPALYGIIAILVALVAGWFGGWAFRR